MITIDDRLRGSAAEVRDLAAGASLPVLGSLEVQPPRRQAQGWVVAAVMSVLVLVMVGGAAWLLWGDPHLEVASGPVTDPSPDLTVTTPSPDATVSDTPAAPNMSWQQAPRQSSLGDSSTSQSRMLTITTGGPGLIAGGSKIPPGASRDDEFPTVGEEAAIWVSEDGVRWDHIPYDDDVFGGPGGYRIYDIAKGGPGYVAVGASVTESGGDVDPMVWVSGDGWTWDRVASPNFQDAGIQWMTDVSTGGPGVIAVGLSTDGTGEAIWISADGLSWERVAADSFRGAVIWDVAQRGQGLVAIGAINHKPTAWLSEDGISWERFKLYPADAEWVGAHPHALVITDETLIAAGFAGEGSFARWYTGVWLSSDGVSWQRVPTFGNNSSFTDADIQGLAATPEGVVAVGLWWNQADNKSQAAIWISIDDGSTWSEVPNEDGVFAGSSGLEAKMMDVTAFGEKLVAVGWDGSEASAWVGSWTD